MITQLVRECQNGSLCVHEAFCNSFKKLSDLTMRFWTNVLGI